MATRQDILDTLLTLGEEKGLYISNYYFEKMLGIDKLMVPSQIISSAALIIIFCLLGGFVIGGLL